MTMTKKAYEKPNTEFVTFDKSICDMTYTCADIEDLTNKSGHPAGQVVNFNIKIGRGTNPNWHALFRSSSLGTAVWGYRIQVPSGYSYTWEKCKTESWEGYDVCELKITAGTDAAQTLVKSSTLVQYKDASGNWNTWTPSTGWTNLASTDSGQGGGRH